MSVRKSRNCSHVKGSNIQIDVVPAVCILGLLKCHGQTLERGTTVWSALLSDLSEGVALACDIRRKAAMGCSSAELPTPQSCQ